MPFDAKLKTMFQDVSQAYADEQAAETDLAGNVDAARTAAEAKATADANLAGNQAKVEAARTDMKSKLAAMEAYIVAPESALGNGDGSGTTTGATDTATVNA